MARVRDFVRAHPRAVLAGFVLLVAMTVFVVVWFQPQKLFIEETVDEAVPSAAPDEGDMLDKTKRSDREPAVLASGSFQSLEHETTGEAKIIELTDGGRFLRFEGLSTSNGPDLRVYLSEIPASDDWYAYRERFIDLGALKGNRGNQNYEIPRGTDLSRYESAVIWCRRFTVGFGVAGLS